MSIHFDAENWICDTQSGIQCKSGGSSSQPAGNTTTVQKSDPWSGQQPYLEDLFRQAQVQFNNYHPQYFPGQTVAPFDPLQTQAINQTAQVAQNNPTAGNASSAVNNYLGGSYLNQQNPYFNQVAQSTLGQVVPQLESQFAAGNGMNRPGAAYAVGQGAASAVGNLAYQDYQNQQANQLKAAFLAPQIQSMPYTDIAQMFNAGAANQSQNQAGINADINKFNFQQSLPFEQMNQYANLISGNYGGTSTLTQPYFQNNSGSNAALGGLGGMALGGLLGGSSGAGIGGTLGSLAMLALL